MRPGFLFRKVDARHDRAGLLVRARCRARGHRYERCDCNTCRGQKRVCMRCDTVSP